MLARKATSKTGKTIPQDWVEGVSRLLNETYKKKNEDSGRYFDVYGQIFPDELLLVVSWVSERDEYQSPITCFLSCEAEQIKDVKKVQETQKNFIDLMGLFFDEIFSVEDWDEFEPNWQEVKHKNETYFYKITRENINLTLEADKLLGPDFDLDENEDIEQ